MKAYELKWVYRTEPRTVYHDTIRGRNEQDALYKFGLCPKQEKVLDLKSVAS